jgi:spermidine synthase
VAPIRIFLTLAAVAAGASVMAIEVAGARLLGPFYGVSLFVWTALITVTLGCLAVGAALGGLQADRGRSPDVLFGLLSAAGAAALLVPAARPAVLAATAPLGPRLGALATAALLFGPSLLPLGAVSPWVVRLVAGDLSHVGRAAGYLGAASTAGSLAGTLATGFYLAAWLGVSRVFTLVGALLLGLAVIYFVAFRRRWRALLLVALAGGVPGEPARVPKVMANGTTVSEITRRDGFYGRVQVVDYRYGTAHTREMLIDGLVQGGVDVASGLSVYEHVYFLELLSRAARPRARSCLVVGLGPGLVPAWFEREGVRTDVVEINPDVVALAREHFGYRPSGRVRIEDARRVLREAGEPYDLVILDVFTGDATPGHVLTREALRDLRSHLAPGGLLVLNLAGSLRRETFGTASVVKTLESVFDTVTLHPTFDPEAGEGWGNVVVLASDVPLAPLDPSLGASVPVHPMARTAVERFLPRTFRFPPGTPAAVLTDEGPLLDLQDTWLRERIRRGLLEATDWSVLS